MNNILVEFIPIVLVFLFAVYPTFMKELSVSFLGRLFAIIIIIFYTSIDKIYGLFACSIIILYYQVNSIEGMDSYCDSNIENDPNKKNYCRVEGMETLTDSLRNQFEKQYCSNGKLTYKNSDVKTEMAMHVFPEINYTNNVCNPCDKTCQYSIIEEKMKHEENIVKPKNSNDWFWTKWSNIMNNQSNPVNSIGVQTEPFSFL
jgi:hypothetical protein